MRPVRRRVIHTHTTTVQLETIQALDAFRGFFDGGHGDEAETARAGGLPASNGEGVTRRDEISSDNEGDRKGRGERYAEARQKQ